MKQLFIILFAISSFIFVEAQPKPDSTTARNNLKAAAQKMAQLFTDKNYASYVKYVHPKIVKMTGGPTQMTEAVAQALKQMEDGGFALTKVAVGEPSGLIYTASEIQSVVPQVLEFKTKDGRLVSTSYLIATSGDKGITWYFIDTSGKTLEQVKSVFPTISSKLVIPEKTQPVFYKD